MLFTDSSFISKLAKTKTEKINCFTKNLSPPMFFEIKTSNFQEMFLDILKNSIGQDFEKIIKKNLINKKKVFFKIFSYKIFLLIF